MNSSQKIFKICFFGPSGSGKSTCAEIIKSKLIQKKWLVKKINVAEPLHQIQKYIYDVFGLANTGQDGPLLQFIAKYFESQLGPCFSKKVAEIVEQSCNCPLVIINSDCRNNSYQYLKSLGFKFIRVATAENNISDRLALRGDTAPAQKNHSVEQTSDIIADYSIDNNDSIDLLSNKIDQLIDSLIISSKRVCLKDLC